MAVLLCKKYKFFQLQRLRRNREQNLPRILISVESQAEWDF